MNQNLAESPQPTDSPKHRLPSNQRRLALIVLAAFLILAAGFYIRGSRADSVPRNPAKPADGIITQLVINESGESGIRTAVVIPVPVKTAWSILSNYDEWERLFNTVRRKQVAEPLGENQHHVVTDVLTPMGTISLDFIVTQEELDDGGYRARWDAPTNELPVNKGTIEIHPLGSDQTLLVYSVIKRYRKYPQFVVNNALFGHQTDIVKTLSTRIVEVARE
jgi:hypothetical protein